MTTRGPFDGGRVVLETLFIRSRWLEASFQALAAAAFVLLAVSARDPLTGIIGILVAKGVPRALKIGKIAAGIRASAVAPLPASLREAPVSFLVEIANGVDAAFLNGLKPADRTAVVRTVFERLHPNPPRAWEAIGLLIAYGGSFVVAFVGAMFIAVAQMPQGQ